MPEAVRVQRVTPTVTCVRDRVPPDSHRMWCRFLRDQARALTRCATDDPGNAPKAARERAVAAAYLDLAYDEDGKGLLW